jgi:hypothetical protein
VRESQEEEMMENKLYAELDRAANRIKVLEAALKICVNALKDYPQYDNNDSDDELGLEAEALQIARAALGSEKTSSE